MDVQEYHYNRDVAGHLLDNKLKVVRDGVSGTLLDMDIDDQAGGFGNPDVYNYRYDAIGNLVRDSSEHIDTILWDLQGKVRAVIRDAAGQDSLLPDLYFWYDGLGRRIRKQVLQPTEDADPDTTDTWYALDPQGNVMAVYEQTRAAGWKHTRVREFPIYGADRLGMVTADLLLRSEPTSLGPVFDPAWSNRALMIGEIMYDSPKERPAADPDSELSEGEFVVLVNNTDRRLPLSYFSLVELLAGDTVVLDSADTLEPQPTNWTPIVHGIGPTLVLTGQPLINKGWVVGRAGNMSLGGPVSARTSVASATFYKWFGQKTFSKPWPSIIYNSKAGLRIAMTKNIALWCGRAVPFVGWAITTVDFTYNVAIPMSEGLQGYQASHPVGSKGSLIYHLCFESGTLIYSDSGFVAIDSISIGDMVHSYNMENGKIESSEVVGVLKQEVEEVYEIKINNETIVATSDHPFYVLGKGWMPVKHLRVGFRLQSAEINMTQEILGIKILRKATVIFNIEVSKNHTFFITRSRILVHNKEVGD